MDMVSILMPTLSASLPWNRARIQFLAHFLIALIKVKTVNFAEIACAFGGQAKPDSSYKRIQRFFRSFPMDFTCLAWLIVAMLPLTGPSWVLTLDRTNWKLGQNNINILVLAIAYKGIAFPILWTLLPKRGNSNTAERISIMERFIRLFGTEKIQCLTADREFLGEGWFSYLLRRGIPFCTRIRENMFIANSRGIPTKAQDLFAHLSLGHSQFLSGRRVVDGHSLFIVGLRIATEYVILVTDHHPHTALADYSRRWEIETLFGCLKSRGFRFEETHLTRPERIQKLIAVLAIAFTWAHIIGEWLHQQKPIKIKKHGRKTHSFFRYGLDHLRKIILNFSEHLREFVWAVRLLGIALTSPVSPGYRNTG